MEPLRPTDLVIGAERDACRLQSEVSEVLQRAPVTAPDVEDTHTRWDQHIAVERLDGHARYRDVGLSMRFRVDVAGKTTEECVEARPVTHARISSCPGESPTGFSATKIRLTSDI